MSLILAGMVNICQLVGITPTLLYLDQIGRRRLAIGGGIAMALPHLVMAGIMKEFSSSWKTHPAAGWAGVAMICKCKLDLTNVARS
jgi:hypothetical protein